MEISLPKARGWEQTLIATTIKTRLIAFIIENRDILIIQQSN
jgi:hypothetical protein